MARGGSPPSYVFCVYLANQRRMGLAPRLYLDLVRRVAVFLHQGCRIVYRNGWVLCEVEAVDQSSNGEEHVGLGKVESNAKSSPWSHAVGISSRVPA